MTNLIKLKHSSPYVTVDRLDFSAQEQSTFDFEIVDDHYAVYLNQRQTSLKVTSNGSLMHHGLVVPGMMRLAAPGEHVHIDLYERCQSSVLNVPGPLLREVLRSVDGTHRAGKVSFVDAFLRPQLEVAQLGRMLLDHEKFDAGHEHIFTRAITEALLVYLVRNHGWSWGEAAPDDRLTDAQLRQAMAFADANMEDLLTLERWAGAMKMPADEFRRRFRQTLGEPPYAWYMDRRIERAKSLLANLGKPLSQVALDVGFSSQSHFTDAFRQRTGMTPASWRAERRRTAQ